jgi:hypothetical protein
LNFKIIRKIQDFATNRQFEKLIFYKVTLRLLLDFCWDLFLQTHFFF